MVCWNYASDHNLAVACADTSSLRSDVERRTYQALFTSDFFQCNLRPLPRSSIGASRKYPQDVHVFCTCNVITLLLHSNVTYVCQIAWLYLKCRNQI